MPVLKVKNNGVWENIGGMIKHTHEAEDIIGLPSDVSNADTLDGKHADEFATPAQINEAIQPLASKQQLNSLEASINQQFNSVEEHFTGVNQQINLMQTDFNTQVSSKVPVSRTINGKNLSADITLTASDVGAPDSQTVENQINQIKPSIQNEQPSNQQALWIDLDDNFSESSILDETLNQQGYAAESRATGNAIAQVAAQVSQKQNKVFFSDEEPANWGHGDIWLKPVE